jgi:hypothetical protein
VHGSNQSHVVAQHVQSRVVEELFVDVKRNEHGHRFQLEDLFVFCNLYFFAPPGSEIMFALLVIEKTKLFNDFTMHILCKCYRSFLIDTKNHVV